MGGRAAGRAAGCGAGCGGFHLGTGVIFGMGFCKNVPGIGGGNKKIGWGGRVVFKGGNRLFGSI